MEGEMLFIEDVKIPHRIIRMIGDGNCLFYALSYIMRGTDKMGCQIRALIVEHVIQNWDRFSILSMNSEGDNYTSAAHYEAEMARSGTYGTTCELVAAGELFPFQFHVVRNGCFVASFGEEGRPVGKLRFMGDLYGGHFDVYETVELPPVAQSILHSEQSGVKFTPEVSQKPSSQSAAKKKSGKKRRARLTNAIRKTQVRKSVAKYAKTNLEIHRAAVAKYSKTNPEINRTAVAKYSKTNPDINQKAVLRYNNINRKSRKNMVLQSDIFSETNNGRCQWFVKDCSALHYNTNIAYMEDDSVCLGEMSVVCKFCSALKFKDESAGLCCQHGKIKLEQIMPPPEPLLSLLMGQHPKAKEFCRYIRSYNNAFQMTSFGAKQVVEARYMPTFKIQGQVYHLAGSVLPVDDTHKFLQLYFIADYESQTSARCSNMQYLNKDLIRSLQDMLHAHNRYILSFKSALEKLPPNTADFKIIIHADRKPDSDHHGRYNIPTSDDVALLIEGQEFSPRDIILHGRDNSIKRISELNRAYDGLQYPLILCRGEDGYSISVPQTHPTTEHQLSKAVSCMNFYAYRMMVRINEFNMILRFGMLTNQFWVDQYAKIESERLSYIRNNQKKLRSESYIHLQDALQADGNAGEVGKLVILPSTFTAGPRYMHERTQDAMTYVRNYGTPDLFITFTCNSNWPEINANLLPNTTPQGRYDVVNRVFHLKVQKLMHLIKKGNIFGATKCFMYTVEWQKRGLPHVHLLLWLQTKIKPEQSLISFALFLLRLLVYDHHLLQQPLIVNYYISINPYFYY